MQKQFLQWHAHTFQRYELTLRKFIKKPILIISTNTNTKSQTHLKIPNPMSSVTQHYGRLEKICLQSNSRLLLNQIELYNTLYQTLSCVSGAQCPQPIKSKHSEAGFKLLKGHTFGAACHLRKKKMLGFSYKWFFIAPCLDSLKHASNYDTFEKNLVCGINNVFIFELDRLNYQTFELMTGLDIAFNFKN